jgi:hypothetical protein
VSESCLTRIPWWAYPRVDWTDGVGFQVHLGAPGSTSNNEGVATKTMGALARSLGTPPITTEQCGTNNILFGNTGGATGNHSYYLSFSDFYIACIQFVLSFMYLCIDSSTHGILGLGAGGA